MPMDEYLEKVKRATLELFGAEKVKIVLFGSRARKNNHATSDIDIGLIPLDKLNKRKKVALEEKIEELNIPYKIEIVDFSETSDNFRQEAMKGAIVWKDWN